LSRASEKIHSWIWGEGSDQDFINSSAVGWQVLMIQKSNQFMLVYFTSFDCFLYIPGGGGKKDNIILAKRRGCDLEQRKMFIWTTLSFWKDPWNS